MLVAGTVIFVLGVVFFLRYAFDTTGFNETARILVGTIGGVAIGRAGFS